MKNTDIALQIRNAEDADIPGVIALWKECELTRPWNDPERDIAFARGSGHAVLLVAETDEGVVASVMTGHDGHRGWMYFLAVSPAMRNNGLGTAMAAAAEFWLRERGVWKCSLMVREDNADALGFYERLGYGRSPVACLQKCIEERDDALTGRGDSA